MEKIKIFIFIAIALLFIQGKSNIYGQPQTCGLSNNSQGSASQTGGIYIPSQGTLKILVVFVRFKDDSTYNPHWPVGQPPNVMNHYIDANSNVNSTNYFNLTHYYDVMSHGTYNVIGHAVYVETPHNQSHYSSRYLATKDVLQNKVDPIVNFADYDNWTFNSNYSHTNQPDGTVDMIVMIWRGLVFSTYWSGEASLGYGNAYTVENGTKTIKTGYGGGNGSGITAQDWEERDEKYNFHVVIHELAHWLLGGKHSYWDVDNSDQHAFWGMLRHSKDGICANAYESERLGWISPIQIYGNINTANISDYLQTGKAYKYHPVHGGSNEYYYFENHQKINTYDDAAENSNDKGIFILHFKDNYNNQNNIRCKTADGQWNWSSTGIASCFGGSNNVRKWKVTSVNRTGKNRRDKLQYNGSYDWIWNIEGEGCAGYPYGANSNNAFNLSFNNVFSPKSNPNSATWSNVSENFTMEVFSKSGSTLKAHFYLSNPYAGVPSKPQNIKVTSNGTHPVVSWDANTEPDLAGYRIYRSVDGGPFYILANVDKYATNYVDVEAKFSKPIWQVKMVYKIKARDTQGKYSVYSNSDYIYAEENNIWKKAVRNAEEKSITTYSVSQNFPNPFNPTTTISYQIPKAGNVQIKVYDVLGKEVALLVNEQKEPGRYNVAFDATNLPSGLYFYRMQAGKFTDVRKMLLMK